MSVDPNCLGDNVQALKSLGGAAIVDAIIFTMVVILSFNCWRGITNRDARYSTKKQVVLLGYVTYMSLAGIASFCQNIYGFLAFLDKNESSTFNTSAVFPLAMWGADGFMTWRCYVLYSDTRKRHRLIILSVLVLLVLSSLTAGGLTFYTLPNPSGLELPLMASFSIITNAILTGLIVALCVESCAIILVFEIPFVVVVFGGLGGPAATILPAVLPQIFVLSALLLISRVAAGRDIRSRASNTLQTIQFHRSSREDLGQMLSVTST
ncbi:hypothetical protein D9613_003738 [Agrocybe pediades]|uniref:Uncharacterized protein n=1 Tax=Agrocybe pediades TaxID=84607 RepID=A0A8H4QIY5_9AGAR|nr:hypothetical protein D9613_003738 [Agrocybe pediades]